MLEQMAYQRPLTSGLQGKVYQIKDLENLSATVLYGRDDYSKGNEENLNFYSWLTRGRFGETDFYLQDEGENHEKFKKKLKSGEASGGTITPYGDFSTGSRY